MVFENMSEVGLLTFGFGLIVGSFLNVLVLRFQTGESAVRDRSRCFSCGKTLDFFELVPLVSFFIQKGKCRGCKSKISLQYPLVELSTGLLFVLVGWKIFGLESGILKLKALTLGLPWVSSFEFQVLRFSYWVAFFSLLLAISVYDIRHKIIPNQFVYPLIVIAFFAPVLNSKFVRELTELYLVENLLSHLAAGVVAFLFFAGLWAISHGRWMGFGDAKLALAIGLAFGYPLTIPALTFSFWIGTIIMLPAVFIAKSSLKLQVPFAPFLALGALTAWLGEAYVISLTSLLFL